MPVTQALLNPIDRVGQAKPRTAKVYAIPNTMGILVNISWRKSRFIASLNYVPVNQMEVS
jgi:hypothetical protein